MYFEPDLGLFGTIYNYNIRSFTQGLSNIKIVARSHLHVF